MSSCCCLAEHPAQTNARVPVGRWSVRFGAPATPVITLLPDIELIYIHLFDGRKSEDFIYTHASPCGRMLPPVTLDTGHTLRYTCCYIGTGSSSVPCTSSPSTPYVVRTSRARFRLDFIVHVGAAAGVAAPRVFTFRVAARMHYTPRLRTHAPEL